MKGIWVALLTLAAGSGLEASIPGVPHTEFRKRVALNSDGRVVLENFYGDVRITAWDRDEVQVEAIKTASDFTRLEEARIVVSSLSPELVTIRTQYGGLGANQPASVEYHITVPRRANLEQIKLVNGGLSLSGLAGPVKASAVNGSIKAERLEGEADLSTVNGKLEADFHRISRAHPISLSSVNGPIKLSIPSGSGASLTARNLSGGIESDLGAGCASIGHRLQAVVKGGGARIHLNNVNGGISIHSSSLRRRSAACVLAAADTPGAGLPATL